MPLGETLQGLTLLAVVVVAAMISGRLFRRIGQPSVLGPITLGVIGGTALAASPAAVHSALVPDSARSLLEAVGTLGLLLLMFTVGAELRGAGGARQTAGGWRLVACVLLPITVGALAAWPFAGLLSDPAHHGPSGWLFVGIALGVTAVPVLVSIIKDLGIAGLPVARSAVRIAVVGDALAWILVTLLVIITHLTAVSPATFAVGLVLLIMMIMVLPRLVDRLRRIGQPGPGGQPGAVLIMTIGATLLGAAATQLLGFHPAIGAVVAGLCFPPGLLGATEHRVVGSMIDVLLPAFFVSAAMSVPLQSLRGELSVAGVWCVVVLAVAAFGAKLAAGFGYGLLGRWPWRSSAGLGVLLNCRGVTEIAIASVGFQAGLIGPFAFATLCGLAIVTTAVTAPLYRAFTAGAGHAGRRSHMSAGLASEVVDR